MKTQWKYTPDKWQGRVQTWLARNDNLPIGCLKRWLPFILTCLVLTAKAAQPLSKAQEERLADAIYIAEGGAKTKHPYGILKKYKTTTPRQACINTIRSNRKRWDGRGDFVVFLGATYCPINAPNDPKGLNVNWVKNVKANWKE